MRQFTIGFANGVFDLLHQGHRHFLTRCRTLCDYLVVAVNSDDYCRRTKGPDRPYNPLQVRMLHVRAFAECVVPFEGRQMQMIMEIRPHVVFEGYDHGSDKPEKIAMRRPGWKHGRPPEEEWEFVPVVKIPHLEGFSTTLEAARLAEERAKG